MKYNIEIVSEEVNKLHFYNKQLIRDYFYEGMRLKDMGEKYNINPQRIARDIRKALIELKPLIENKIKL
jgi:DNA-directed RNA polymerase specialized sigma subunit